jgi:putative ABC transport system ATP-binding protein/lipoprotein-releasing system ATP-binding protein
LISLQNLKKSYKAGGSLVYAVDNVSLEVSKGDFTAILGHSGSGKTTLLNLIGGLTRPDSGTVTIDNTNIWNINDNRLSELRNEKMNFIFQFSSLLPTLTVLENVILPTIFSSSKSGENTTYALELLDLVGMTDKKNSYPSQLSGGQQRRAAIARAFINNPAIILADEPTGDLDEETEREVVKLFQKFNEEKKITFLIVTHSSELASMTQKQLKMTNGQLTILTT